MRTAPTVALLSFVLSCTTAPPLSIPPAVALSMQTVPPAWDDEPVVVPAETTSVELVPGEHGNTARVRECTWMLINKRHPNVLETVDIPDYETTEEVPEVRAWAFYPDGSSWRLNGSALKRYPYVRPGLLSSNTHYQRFAFPRYGPRMLIRLEVRRRCTRPAYLKAEYLRGVHNCLHKTIVFTVPADARIRYEVRNAEGLAIDTLHTEDSLYKTLEVRGSMLPKLNSANKLRNPEEWYAGLHFSLPPEGLASYTWRQLGDHYLDMIEHAFAPSAAIAELASSIGPGTAEQTVDSAFALIRDRIRYVARLDEIHAIVPRPAREVLTRGYGDCKEISALLKALLARRDIEVNVALVATRGRKQVLDEVPTLGGFDHVVVYREEPDSTLHFYDAVNKYATPRNSHLHLVGQKVLLLSRGKSRLSVIPAPADFLNRIVGRCTVERTAAGKRWRIRGTIRLLGYAAYRLFPLLEDLRDEELHPFLCSYLDEAFRIAPTSTAITLEGRDTIDIAFQAPFQRQYVDIENGGFILNCPSVFGGDVRFTTLDYEGPRFFQGYEQQDTWVLPPGFTDLDAHEVEHPLARGGWELTGNELTRRFRLKTTQIPSERRKEVSELLRQKTRFAKTTVWRE